MKKLTTEKKEVNWNRISRRTDLTPNFIRKHASELNWVELLKYDPLALDFFEESINSVDWRYFAEEGKIPEKHLNRVCLFLEKHLTDTDWGKISRNLSLSEDFLLRFFRKIYGRENPRF